MKQYLLFLSVLLSACGVKLESDADGDAQDDVLLVPNGDEDGDGYTNNEEMEQGSDPLNAYDIPYVGGWYKDACRNDVVSSGNELGEVAEDFALVDQFGDTVYLHDFCNRVVLLEFAGFT